MNCHLETIKEHLQLDLRYCFRHVTFNLEITVPCVWFYDKASLAFLRA